jgi:hypothetical protein
MVAHTGIYKFRRFDRRAFSDLVKPAAIFFSKEPQSGHSTTWMETDE